MTCTALLFPIEHRKTSEQEFGVERDVRLAEELLTEIHYVLKESESDVRNLLLENHLENIESHDAAQSF